jgi:hypothetical protein
MGTVFDLGPRAREDVMVDDGNVVVATQNRVAVESPHVIPLKLCVT